MRKIEGENSKTFKDSIMIGCHPELVSGSQIDLEEDAELNSA